MDMFRDIINAWPSIAAFAEDAGVTCVHARTMRTRDRIPSAYWESLVAGAIERSIPDITFSLFAAVSRRRNTRVAGASNNSDVGSTIPANPSQIKANAP